MLFNSLTFIAFFVIVLLVHLSPIGQRGKKVNLLLASYIFYAVWNPPFVFLLWISTVVDWFAARGIASARSKSGKRGFLLLSLCTNLGLLGFFKYGDFLLENFVYLVGLAGIEYSPPDMGIILPVGISFYTFQTLSYTLDVYREETFPARSFLDFSLYVTFFPQLVAGPIVRPNELIPQLEEPARPTQDQFLWGLFLLSLGLFEKVVLADGLVAAASDEVFGFEGALSPLDAWVGSLAFTAQIFCDFAGYSTCAIGTALCFGYRLPNNFRFPYAACGFKDFWQRWHISLSRWLRDYLYIPLGGNRKGPSRTYVNLMITMLIGGLWHGPAWTFVAWGAIHGIYLVAERLLVGVFKGQKWTSTEWARFIFVLVTFFLTVITWVFFRAQDFQTAWRILLSMFGFVEEGAKILTTLSIVKVLFVMTLVFSVHWYMRDKKIEGFVANCPWWIVSVLWSVMVILLVLMQGSSDAFIYFQF